MIASFSLTVNFNFWPYQYVHCSYIFVMFPSPQLLSPQMEEGLWCIFFCVILFLMDDVIKIFVCWYQERDQRYKELGLRDKITLSSGRFLLGNKYASTTLGLVLHKNIISFRSFYALNV